MISEKRIIDAEFGTIEDFIGKYAEDFKYIVEITSEDGYIYIYDLKNISKIIYANSGYGRILVRFYPEVIFTDNPSIVNAKNHSWFSLDTLHFYVRASTFKSIIFINDECNYDPHIFKLVSSINGYKAWERNITFKEVDFETDKYDDNNKYYVICNDIITQIDQEAFNAIKHCFGSKMPA